MKSNIFFKKKNIQLKQIFPNLKIKKNFVINSIKPLTLATSKDITFFDSLKYKDDLNKTKAEVCITSQKFEKLLPKKLS